MMIGSRVNIHPKRLKRVGTVFFVSLFVIGFSLFFRDTISDTFAATQTITSRVDFKTGFFDGTEADTKEGELKLKGDGTWTARVWRTPYLTLNDGTAFASDGTYTYMIIARDTRFVRYLPKEDRWQALAKSPHMPYTGSEMVRVGNYLYVSFGGYQKEFSRYSIIDNTWTELADMPDLVSIGSALGTDGTYIYALKGTSTSDFWRYNPATDTWGTLTSPPATIGGGADFTYDESTGTAYLYTPRGLNTTTFYRYDIAAGTWATMAVIPAAFSETANMAKRGDYIYAIRGVNTTSFYRYQISTNIWSTIATTPTATRYVGIAYNTTEDLLYVFRGNNTYDWWKYDPDTDTFSGNTDLPAAPSTGADLVQYNGSVYYRRGASTNAFYSLNTSTGAWTTHAVAPATFADDTKGATASGNLYFIRGSNTTAFYRYTIAGDSWSTLAVAPATMGYGASVAYPGTGNYLYATRGSLTTSFYRYDFQADSWSDGAVADLPTGYEIGYGGRIVSDGQNVYAITGSGIANILRYDIGTNTWTVLGTVPFSPFYGTDIVYYNGKIYAQSGYYKTDFWEYTLASGTWRRLPDMAGTYASDIGPYAGGSLASDGVGTLYSISGNSLIRLLQFSVAATNYPISGTWTSKTYDFTYVSSWTSLVVTATTPGDAAVVVETRSSSDKSTWSEWEVSSGGEISSPVNRYLEVRTILHATTDRTLTPTISSVVITYSGDTTVPSNPTSITGMSKDVGGVVLTSGVSYPHTQPYFSWSGASDSQTSVSGYYVYFGTNASADPETVGNFQNQSTYVVTTPLATGTYYLRIKTKDAAGNIAATALAFTYLYAGVSPTQQETFTTTADFSGSGENVNIAADAIKLASSSGFWEQDRLSLAPATMYYGASFAYVSASEKLYTFRGLNTTTFYEYDIATDVWTSRAVAPAAVYQGGDLVEGPDGYLYGFPGRNLNTFWRYDIANDTWSDAAAADAPLSLYYGSAMIYDGSQYIYVLRGNSDDAFMRYDTQTDTWDSLTNTDFGAPSVQPNNNVYIGGDLTHDRDGTIYAIQANLNTGFSSYSVSTNSWTTLPNLPVIPYDGSQISYDSTSNAIYYISGWTNPFLYKYDLSTQTWVSLPDAPAPFAGGASMRNVDGTLYMLRGSQTNTFWKYDIDKVSWKTPTVGLFGTEFRGTDYRPFNSGANIVKGDESFYYLVRGNYDNMFLRYDGDSGEAVEMASVPSGFYLGSSLAYDSTQNKIYAISSQYTTKLFVYDIATDVWTEVSTDPPPVDPGTGASMTYDGSQYLYWIRGAGTVSAYRYDTQGNAGNRWSSITNAPGALGYGAEAVYKDGLLYVLRGNNVANNPLYRYDPDANSWTTLAGAPIDVYNDGFMVDGGGDFLYMCKGENTVGCYQYSITTNSWTAIANAPANISVGGAAASNGSNRIYMIAGAGTNTFANGLYTYIMQTDSSSFVTAGSYTSPTHDVGSVYKFSNIVASYTSGVNAAMNVYTRSSADENTWSTWAQTDEEKAIGGTYTYAVNSPNNQYIQVRFDLTSSDGISSGVLHDYTLTYFEDSIAPTNPSSISVYSSATQSAGLTTNNWYNYAAPNFDWPEASASGGASDGEAGSGVSGYYVYFGTNAAADPQTDGTLQSTTAYTAASVTSGNTYYLRIKAQDDAENVAVAVWEPFIYKFDNEVPTNPSTVVADPPGYSATNEYDFSWSNATDSASGILDYCYKIGALGEEVCNVTTASASATASVTGANTFYVRARDRAGNLANSFVNASYYYSSTAPSDPQAIEVTPEVNTKNEFAFAWNPPSLYYGAQAGLRYYYSVNTQPTAQSVNSVGLTTAYLSESSYATVPGENIFYVVAKDEAGNIDYNNYASVTFTADTSAPGIPNDLEIADISVKALKSWKLALSWEAPISSASGIASYKVYASKKVGASCTSDFSTFSYIATTTGKSYVDSELAQEDHFYCVKACDSTGNCSAPSETVTMLPDGKWEDAPQLTASSSATVKTKSAIIAWSTDRPASSFVKYGKSSGEYTSEAGSSTQVAAHSITLSGLDPGTTYYYKLLWADEDGNEGASDERTFTTNAAPFISNVSAKNISLNTANIAFTVSNATSVTVQYGETLSYGLTTDTATSKEETTTAIPLGGLTEGTLYHFRLVAEDEEGNTFAGDDYTFETLPVPQVSNVKVQQVAGLPTATLRVLWTSNTPISTIVTYYPTANAGAANDYITLALASSHEVILKNLQNATGYTIVVKGKDAAGNEAVATPLTVKTAVDFRAPEILNLNVESIIVGVGTEARAQLIVSWDTDEPSTTQVAYAEGTGTSYNQSTQEDENLTTNHVVTITGLTPSKIYHLQALSDDKAGNTGKSFDTVVVTPRSTKAALNLVIDNLSKTFGFLKGFGSN